MIRAGFNVKFCFFGMDYHGTLDNLSGDEIYLGLALTTTSAMSLDNTLPAPLISPHYQMFLEPSAIHRFVENIDTLKKKRNYI